MKAEFSRRSFSLLLACAGVAPALSSGAARENNSGFPERAMKMLVPFPPGSGTDATARVFAKKISELTGQGVAVDNKPGANGFIGVQAVLHAAADGHTIFIGSNSTLSANAALMKNLPYDPLRDFAPISILIRGPCVLIVPPKSPYQTLAELIDDARKRPEHLNYGSGSVSYKLYTEWFNQMHGIRATEVPYKGAGDVVKAIAAAEVDFAVTDRSGAVELVKGEKIRALVQTASRRSPLLPDVPSSAEAGVPEYLASTWVAAAVSAKTPADIVARVSDIFAQAGNSAEIRDYYAQQSAELLMSSAQEMRKFQKEEIARWKRLAAVAKIGLQ